MRAVIVVPGAIVICGNVGPLSLEASGGCDGAFVGGCASGMNCTKPLAYREAQILPSDPISLVTAWPLISAVAVTFACDSFSLVGGFASAAA